MRHCNSRVGPSVLRRPANRSLPATRLAPSSGWAVRPSAASARSNSEEENSASVVSRKEVQFGNPRTVDKATNVKCIKSIKRGNPTLGFLRCCAGASSSALRGTAAPGPLGRSGASYRSRRAASCCMAASKMPSSSTMRPNPSIEEDVHKRASPTCGRPSCQTLGMR